MALPGTLQYILYSVVKPLPDLHTKALAFLTHLSQKGDGFLQRLCQQILQYNIMVTYIERILYLIMYRDLLYLLHLKWVDLVL